MNDWLPLEKLRTDGGTQPRAQVEPDVVDEYAGLLAQGVEFPPAVVFHDGAAYWLADGYHRFFAAKKAGRKSLPCDIRQGTVDDARWHALGANKSHGLRRTNEDKRRAIEAALKMKPEMSDRAIADHCGVDHKTVAAARPRLSGELPQIDTREVTRGGTTYTQDTSNIGRRREELSGERPRTYADAPAEPPEKASLRLTATERNRGKVLQIAQDAINCLRGLPSDHGLRRLCFDTVTGWIKRNQ